MDSEFHIYFSDDEAGVTVRQSGLQASRDFPSLGEATRHLRSCMSGKGGLVVLHNPDSERPNRIPLDGGVSASV